MGKSWMSIMHLLDALLHDNASRCTLLQCNTHFAWIRVPILKKEPTHKNVLTDANRFLSCRAINLNGSWSAGLKLRQRWPSRRFHSLFDIYKKKNNVTCNVRTMSEDKSQMALLPRRLGNRRGCSCAIPSQRNCTDSLVPWSLLSPLDGPDAQSSESKSPTDVYQYTWLLSKRVQAV